MKIEFKRENPDDEKFTLYIEDVRVTAFDINDLWKMKNMSELCYHQLASSKAWSILRTSSE